MVEKLDEENVFVEGYSFKDAMLCDWNLTLINIMKIKNKMQLFETLIQ